MTAAGETPAIALSHQFLLKNTPSEYRPTLIERRLNRTSVNIDPAFDDADVDDFLTELNLSEHLREENNEW